MEIALVERIERKKGVASTVTAEDVQKYTEGVERFLRENSGLGDDWVRKAVSQLYVLDRNENRETVGSNTPVGVAFATFTDVPLITGQQLLEMYEQAGKTNPFGNVYIDFGTQINGSPKVNPVQAKILVDDFKSRGINLGEGRVPNFSQLRLIADKNEVLAYKLAEDVKEVASVSDYPFVSVRKDGLLRACLGRDSWGADVGCLAGSSGSGRVVRYDAEGVARKKPESDSVSELTREFRKRF